MDRAYVEGYQSGFAGKSGFAGRVAYIRDPILDEAYRQGFADGLGDLLANEEERLNKEAADIFR